MNVNDTEIVHGVLKKHNYSQTDSTEDADVVLLMTCAIRDGAEQKIWQRLSQLKSLKRDRQLKKEPPMTIGVLGITLQKHMHSSFFNKPLSASSSFNRMHGRKIEGQAAGKRECGHYSWPRQLQVPSLPA